MNIGLVSAYSIDNSTGVGQFVVVVQGAEDGGCKIPTAVNAAGFLGVTLEARTIQNSSVSVCKSGTVRVVAGGTITRGDRLRVHSNAGDVESCEAAITAAPGTAAVFNVIGMAEVSAVAGDIFDMFIAPCVVNVAVS
jgi:hypothetical protein